MNAKLLRLLAIVLPALMGISHAVGIDCVNSFLPSLSSLPMATQPTLLLGIALIALMVNISVVAIGYIISKIVPTSGLAGWMNNEYWEITKTAMLIVGIFSVLVFLGNIASAIAGPIAASYTAAPATSAPSDPFASLAYYAENYLCQANNTVASATYDTVGLSLASGLVKSIQVSYYVGVPPVPVGVIPTVVYFGFKSMLYSNPMITSALIGVLPYESIVNDLLQMVILPMSIITYAQMLLLPTIMAIGLGILIPLGIVLRAFPFIRGIGGTLIALGVGMALIYPAALGIFNEYVWSSLATTTPFLSSNSCSLGFLCIVVSFFESAFGRLEALGTAFSSIQNIYPALNFILPDTIGILTHFILFIMDIIIVYPVMDNLAKMLGNPAGVKLQFGKLSLV